MRLVLPNPVALSRKANGQPRFILGFVLVAGVAGYALWQADKARKAKAAAGEGGPVGKNWGPLYDTYALSNEGSAAFQLTLPAGSHVRMSMIDSPSTGYFWQAHTLSGSASVEVEVERLNGNVVGRIKGKEPGPAKVVFSLIGPNQSILASDTFDIEVG